MWKRTLFRPLIFAALAVAALMIGAMPTATLMPGTPIATAASLSVPHDAVVVARAEPAVSPAEIRDVTLIVTTIERTPVSTAVLSHADYRAPRLHIDPGRTT